MVEGLLEVGRGVVEEEGVSLDLLQVVLVEGVLVVVKQQVAQQLQHQKQVLVVLRFKGESLREGLVGRLVVFQLLQGPTLVGQQQGTLGLFGQGLAVEGEGFFVVAGLVAGVALFPQHIIQVEREYL